MPFTEFIAEHKVTIRPGFFFGVLAIMTLREIKMPHRTLTVSKAIRYAINRREWSKPVDQ